MIRQVLAKDPDEPICDACAGALGAHPTVNAIATVSTRACCLCDEERPCAAIRDWSWPTNPTAGRGDTRALHQAISADTDSQASAAAPSVGLTTPRRPHDEPDDYSELETLLGRRA